MKIQSTKKKTEHIIAALVPFAPPHTDDEFMEYAYLYFKFNDFVKQNVKEFQKQWEKAKSRVEKFPVSVYNAVLIREILIENAENSTNPDYKYFKYDSLNHIETDPEFEENDRPYGIDARILCSFNYFEIEVERIPDGWQMPLIIYRSPSFIYSKLF